MSCARSARMSSSPPWAGPVHGSDVLAGKHVGVYYSASWCPPCQKFTPILAAALPALSTKGLEIVFVSHDRTEAAFEEYYGRMPWLAVPFADEKLRDK